MSSILRQYRLTLTTDGPVFIGSGERRTHKEYVVGKDSKRVHFPDMAKLYAEVVARRRQSQFEDFVLGRATHGRPAARLGEWLDRNGIALDPTHHGGYAVPIGSMAAGKARRGQRAAPPALNDIHMCIKDGFGNPYVPGSSLKGMIRSLILNYLASRKPDAKPNTRVVGAREAGDAVNDMLQAVRVADSPPLSLQDLVIAQKVDANVRGEESPMPLYREAIAPGVRITFDVTVDESLTIRGEGVGVEASKFVRYLPNLAGAVFQHRYASYLDKYQAVNGFVPSPQTPHEAPVYLGGGAGFRSKTIVQEQAHMARILDAQFRKVKHVQKAEQLGVSPLALKIAVIDRKTYEWGRCVLQLSPIE